MSSNLVEVLTLRAIEKLADTGTLSRGTAYFHDGAVGLLDADEYEVRASVQGTQRYRVRLAAGSDGELEYDCDCPVGDDGVFCKHAVAVALSWLENAGEEVFEASEEESAKPRKKRKTRDEQIREYLGTLDESALRGWLMEQILNRLLLGRSRPVVKRARSVDFTRNGQRLEQPLHRPCGGVG